MEITQELGDGLEARPPSIPARRRCRPLPSIAGEVSQSRAAGSLSSHPTRSWRNSRRDNLPVGHGRRRSVLAVGSVRGGGPGGGAAPGPGPQARAGQAARHPGQVPGDHTGAHAGARTSWASAEGPRGSSVTPRSTLPSFTCPHPQLWMTCCSQRPPLFRLSAAPARGLDGSSSSQDFLFVALRNPPACEAAAARGVSESGRD